MTDATRPADDLTATNGAMLVIISGPSGVGKDTIIDALRERPHDPDYHYVVTCTTRGRRRGEVDGVDYHFLDPERFAALRAAGEFLEASEVHENWYGTPRGQVREALQAGRDVILKIDVQGAQVVKGKVPGALLIFRLLLCAGAGFGLTAALGGAGLCFGASLGFGAGLRLRTGLSL